MSHSFYFDKSQLIRLAKKHGTPTYVYSASRVQEKIKLLKNAFTQPLTIHYAMKANDFPPLLRVIKKAGCGVDVVSFGEIDRAMSCGFKPSAIIFSGVGKSVEEIRQAIILKIKLLNVESPQELERIGAIAKKLKTTAVVAFRLNPAVNPKTHPYIATGFKENKFGMDASFLPELIKILKKYKNEIELAGLDFHIGSQLLELKPFKDALKKSLPIYRELVSQGHPLRYFDIGGGVGISYQGQKTIDLEKYAQAIEVETKPLGCEILCEPGRFLVADAGVLITKVEYVKKTPYKNFVIIDSGMHHLIRPALYGSHHEILPLNKIRGGKKIKVDVVGPICESADFLAKDFFMIEPNQNNLLAVCDSGAYGAVMASHYNLQKSVKEILIK